jgi:hypothetical protein
VWNNNLVPCNKCPINEILRSSVAFLYHTCIISVLGRSHGYLVTVVRLVLCSNRDRGNVALVRCSFRYSLVTSIYHIRTITAQIMHRLWMSQYLLLPVVRIGHSGEGLAHFMLQAHTAVVAVIRFMLEAILSALII